MPDYIFLISSFTSGLNVGQFQASILADSTIITQLIGIIETPASGTITVRFVSSLSVSEYNSLLTLISTFVPISYTMTRSGANIAFNILEFQAQPNSTVYQSISYFAWDNLRYGGLMNGKIVLSVEFSNRSLQFQLYDTVNAITLSTGSIGASGVFEFDVQKPISTTTLALQIRNGAGTISSILQSATLVFIA